MEAEPGNGLYRSDDAGATWRFLTGERNLTGRAFYYHHVIADPGDENTVYIMHSGAFKSIDGGATVEGFAQAVHGDHHGTVIS